MPLEIGNFLPVSGQISSPSSTSYSILHPVVNFLLQFQAMFLLNQAEIDIKI